jgi:hypothetical protein
LWQAFWQALSFTVQGMTPPSDESFDRTTSRPDGDAPESGWPPGRGLGRPRRRQSPRPPAGRRLSIAGLLEELHRDLAAAELADAGDPELAAEAPDVADAEAASDEGGIPDSSAGRGAGVRLDTSAVDGDARLAAVRARLHRAVADAPRRGGRFEQ